MGKLAKIMIGTLCISALASFLAGGYEAYKRGRAMAELDLRSPDIAVVRTPYDEKEVMTSEAPKMLVLDDYGVRRLELMYQFQSGQIADTVGYSRMVDSMDAVQYRIYAHLEAIKDNPFFRE